MNGYYGKIIVIDILLDDTFDFILTKTFGSTGISGGVNISNVTLPVK